MKNYTEIIQSITPLLLCLVGCVVGVAVVFSDLSDAKAAAGFGLAGTAVAGAAGLAQTVKKE